jgi:EmrB/QacA subfamily drug resistance transporter
MQRLEPSNQREGLATRRGVWILLLLCAIQFLDILDASIVNVALPSIKRDLHFSEQTLQWVVSGYIITYGGFLLLGGRAADLLGRRRVLVSGLVLFALASLAGGMAPTAAVLVAARLVQGAGAAMMSPAALSTLTTTFTSGRERNTAMGAWAGVAGVAGALGGVFGGLLTQGPGWRWVLFVNPPVCVLAVLAALWLLRSERGSASARRFDLPGAVLATGGMLLLVYALVDAPGTGWGSARIIAELSVAVAVLVAFVINERLARNPLAPLSILRLRGLAAADATQLVTFAGLYALFFFLTLYMQTVLDWSPLRTAGAYMPLAIALIISAGGASQLIPRLGTRPLMVGGALVAGVGLWWFSGIGVQAAYVHDMLPGLLMVAVGGGAVFVAATTAANAGVGADRAGLAAGLLNTSQQLGGSLGLAILSALATARTTDLLHGAAHASLGFALTAGFQRAFAVAGLFCLAGACIAMTARNSRQVATAEPDVAEHEEPEPAVAGAA